MRISSRKISFYATIPLLFILLYGIIALYWSNGDIRCLSPAISLIIGLFVWNKYSSPIIKKVSMNSSVCEKENGLKIECYAPMEMPIENIRIFSNNGHYIEIKDELDKMVLCKKSKIMINVDWDFIAKHKDVIDKCFTNCQWIRMCIIDSGGLKLWSQKFYGVKFLSGIQNKISGVCFKRKCVEKVAYRMWQHRKDKGLKDNPTSDWQKAEEIINGHCSNFDSCILVGGNGKILK